MRGIQIYTIVALICTRGAAPLSYVPNGKKFHFRKEYLATSK